MSSTLLLGYIWANALWLQPGRHPAPMFQPAAIGQSMIGTEIVNPPVPAIRGENYAAQIDEVSDTEHSQLLLGLQNGLRTLGYYNGDVDGLDGPMTKGAVASYEVAQGMPATGKATVRLLAHIRQTARVAAEEQARQRPVQTELQNGSNEEFQLILSVQRALADLGYAPGPVNGALSKSSVDAIRRFQADRGMPINGKLTVTLILELEAVSGIPLNRDS